MKTVYVVKEEDHDIVCIAKTYEDVVDYLIKYNWLYEKEVVEVCNANKDYLLKEKWIDEKYILEIKPENARDFLLALTIYQFNGLFCDFLISKEIFYEGEG